MSKEVANVAADSARGGVFLVVGNISATIIAAVGSFLVARLLGPEFYGVYTLCFVVPSLFLLFTDLGIDQSLIRFSASLRAQNQRERLWRLLRYSLLFKLLATTIIFSMCFIFSDYLATYVVNRSEIGVFVRLASISIIFQAVFSSISSVFVGLDLMEYSALLTDTQAILKAVTSPLLVILGFGIFGAITGFVLSYLVGGLLSVALLFLKFDRSSNNNDDPYRPSAILKNLLGYGFPLYISAILAGFIPIYQSVILAFFASDFDIGNFKASFNFITLMILVAAPVSTSIFQAFSKLSEKSKNAGTFFTLSVKYTSLLMVPFTTVVIIFAKEIVQVVYGTSFLYAPFYLTLYASLYLLVGLGFLVLSGFFNGLGETRTTFKINLVLFSLFIFLAPPLAKMYSVPGLIIALLISYIISTIVGLRLAKSKFKVELNFKSVIRIYAVALISAFPAFPAIYFPLVPELIKVLLGGLVYMFSYTTLITLVRIITKPELERIEQVIERLSFLKPLTKPLLSYVNWLGSYKVQSINQHLEVT